MTGLFFVLLFAGIAGAIVCGKRKLKIPMVGCIIVATAAAFLIACTFLLLWGID